MARASMLPADYSARAHILRTSVIAIGICVGGVWLARSAAAVDWLLLPAFFVVANLLEWLVHKNPMHRPLQPRILYVNHALVHHRAFLQDTMPINSLRELGLIMMPWYTMLGLFAVASPVALLAAWWRGWGAAGIFFLAAALYFIAYEGMHALYHQSDDLLASIGLGGKWFDRLRSHHRHHHRLDRMSHVNFNVTLPLMDWLFGTKEREGQAIADRQRDPGQREGQPEAGVADQKTAQAR
jgi:hypothetical protein